MFPSIDFLLATTAVIIIIICYVVLLSKLKPSNGSSESPDFPELLQKTEENLSVTRRTEIAGKNQRRKDKRILGQKKAKTQKFLKFKEWLF